MSSKTNLELLHGDGGLPDQPKRLGIAIELLRARILEEFKISERLNAKARQITTLAIGFFAVAQTVAFGGFGIGQVSGVGQYAIAGFAALAVVALARTGQRLAQSERPLHEKDLDPEIIERWAREHDDEMFARKVIVNLREVADSRHSSNKRRIDLYRRVEYAGKWSLALTTLELLVAIGFRA